MSIKTLLKRKAAKEPVVSPQDVALEEEAKRLASILHAAGKEVKTLRCGWKNEAAKKGLLYFLVPANLEEANFGWFTEEELIDWTYSRGVVVKDPLLDRMDGLNEFTRIADKMLETAGVRVRAKTLAAWAVSESKVPGVRVLVHPDDQEFLPDGIYTLHHLSVMLSVDNPELANIGPVENDE